jgi:hypothetical protein
MNSVNLMPATSACVPPEQENASNAGEFADDIVIMFICNARWYNK